MSTRGDSLWLNFIHIELYYLCVIFVFIANVTWSFECADVTDSSKLPDSCLTTVMMETASTTVPILFKAFVEEQQKQSHEDTFKRIKDHFG